MPDSSPDRLSLAQEIAVFRQRHPPTTFRHEDIEWSYVAAGRGSHGVLLLPGAAGGGEAYFRLVPRLEDSYRMIMINYPQVEDLASLLSGLSAILDREGIDKTALVGGSAGGMVAQAFLLTFPKRTSRAALNATAPPSKERARTNLKMMPVVRLIPMPVIRGLMRLVIRKLMKSIEIEREFWGRYYLDAVNSLSRADLNSRYAFEIPFDQEYGDRLHVLDDWKGAIQILEGSDDSLVKKRRELTLQEAYPQATVHTFEGAGHGLSLERPEEWQNVICSFLLEEPSVAS